MPLVGACALLAQACGAGTPAQESGPGPLVGEESPVDHGGGTVAPGAATNPEVEPGGDSPAAAVDPAPAAELSAVYQAILLAHNRHRARHCAAPLRWSAAVAAVAQAWADQLVRDECAFEHSKGNKYGGNLFFMGPSDPGSAVIAADEWYSEITAYDYGAPGFGMSTGHFTQVVWRASTELGCAVAQCNGGDLWVCNYNPPGNVHGQYPANVKPTGCK